jgi:PAS domain S-box-containing protein
VTDPDKSFELARHAALEASAEELYDGAPCGYVSTAPDGRIVRANATLLRWTGYTAEELIGRRRFAELLTRGGRIYYETHYAPLLRMQGAVGEIALDLVRRDGATMPVLAHSAMRSDAAGQPVVSHTTLFDARQRREYERELLRARERAEAADRAKAEFISTVSHEIRSPLSALMAVGYLLESTEPSEKQQKYLRILRSSSENLLNLVNDVLDFSRLEAGRLQLDERPFDLRPLLEELAGAQRVKADEKGVRLELIVDARCPEKVIGDRVKVGQILTNLVGNAVKFTEAGSVIVRVAPREVTARDALLDFAVSDTGIGVSPERLPHIFESFTQASAEVTARYGGSGLGLAITKRLVELHGSELRVESRLGEGSVFSFGLRLGLVASGVARSATASAPGAEPPPLAGLRLLVADDNEANLVVLGDLLHGWGAAVDLVADGSAAVERIRLMRPDLVLMDLRMPKVDGVAAATEIRALTGCAELPIIAVSGSKRMGEAAELTESGFDDFVGKPVYPDLLLEKIRRCLGR